MKFNKMVKEVRTLSITKRLNILIGSGVSVPIIPLMSDNIYYKTNEYGEKIFCPDLLTKKVIEVSKKILDGDYEINIRLQEYKKFLEQIVELLNISNSRQTPKSVNIFSTNYDLFIEKAMDEIIHSSLKLIFNDGANGYFNRYLDSYNFDKFGSYRGQFERYTDEIPSVSLIKPHGSVNWKYLKNDQILIKNDVEKEPFIVKPDGHEAANTFEENHFFAMLRLFQQELEKDESILIVYGFSFGDDHIKKMVERSLQNPSLNIYYFLHRDNDKEQIANKLGEGLVNSPQFNLIWPRDLDIDKIELSDITAILRG